MRLVESTELELLLLCARGDSEGIIRDRILQTLDESLDRAKLAQLARCHGLTPLVYRALQGIGSHRACIEISEMLRTEALAIRFRNLVLVRELLTILHALEGEGIAATPYKGPALSAYLFQDPTLRRVADLDLLVRPADAIRARSTLLRLGYAEKRHVPKAAQAAFVRLHCDFSFNRLDAPVLVELHWRIAPVYWRLPEIPELAWQRMQRVSLLGVDVPWFSPEQLLFILCIHGCTHKWRALKWIVDVAELLRIRGDLEWDRVMEEACRTGCQRMVTLGVYLAVELLDAPVPSKVITLIRADRTVARLAEEVCAGLAAIDGDPLGMPEKLRFLTRLSQRLDMKVMFLALIPGYSLLHSFLRQPEDGQPA